MSDTRFTYKIDENNAILIFDNLYPCEDGSPNIFQPGHPTSVNTPWSTKEDAIAYAEQTIDALLNPPPAVESTIEDIPPTE